ncbi:MAG TPA: hypothetical protein VHE83_13075, partial [Mycobacteriales bacterium]|nr:hypothetical protein [Mycobacteriales bacterium]
MAVAIRESLLRSRLEAASTAAGAAQHELAVVRAERDALQARLAELEGSPLVRTSLKARDRLRRVAPAGSP